MSSSACYSGTLAHEPIIRAEPAVAAALQALRFAASQRQDAAPEPVAPAVPVLHDMVEHYALESARSASHYAAFS